MPHGRRAGQRRLKSRNAGPSQDRRFNSANQQVCRHYCKANITASRGWGQNKMSAEPQISSDGRRRTRREVQNPVLTAALDLAANGLPVFPCSDWSKRPTTPNGFKNASTDPEEIRRLWRAHPGGLIGVPTGNAIGLDVLDLDFGRHQEACDWWRDNRHRIPRTRTHGTRSAGIHLLFQHDDLVHCTAGKIRLGIDTRGTGGYIIHWPSHGLPLLSDAPPAPWPDWLLAEFRPKPKPQPRSRSVVRVPDNHLLARLVQMVAGAREGERNSLTFWCACRAGEMVASGLLNAGTAIAVIAEAATRAGLARAEAERTARSGVVTGGGNV